VTYLATSLKLAKFSVTERTACVTSDPDLKVTTFLDNEYLRNDTR